MVGYKAFSVMYGGILHYPESDLTLENSVIDEKEEFWADVYRVGPYEGNFLVYYGEEILGHTYIRFTHDREAALSIAKNWLERWEV